MRKQSNRSCVAVGLAASTLALFATLAGCAASGELASFGTGTRAGPSGDLSTVGTPVGLDSLPTERYFPLKRFFSWTYAVSIKSKTATASAEDTLRVENLTGSSGLEGKLSLKRTMGGTLVLDVAGTVSQASNAITINLADRVETIQLPLKAGAEWTSGTLKARSFKVDKLTVAGTTYTDLVGITYTRDGEVVAVRWLAPRKGIVKQLSRTKSDGSDIEVVSELTKAYTIGVAAISLSPTATISLTPAATAGISALLAMEEDGLTSQEITFSSSNNAVASVAKSGTDATGRLKGTVTGVATGSAVITAKSDQDPTKVATVSVEVK